LSHPPAQPRPDATEAFTRLTAYGATLGVVSAASTATVHADAHTGGLNPLLHFLDGDVTDKTHQLRQRRTTTRALYIGDTAYDIHSGRAAGYQTVAITNGYTPTRTLHTARPDHIIDSLTELLDLLT
ncbi:HAD family hydrolase, partial [Frankia sp. CcWB3]